MEYVKILDTTLRDGDQAAGVAFTPAQKVAIAEKLEVLKVDIMEVGFPSASELEFSTVKTIAGFIRDCTVSVFARGLLADIERAADAVSAAARARVEVAVPVSDFHIKGQMGSCRDDALEMTRMAVRAARNLVPDVQWIGVDATRADPDYLARHAEAAIEAGASTVTIADTVGFAGPSEIEALIRNLLDRVPGFEKCTLSIHCHDDLGLATANTLAALLAGAREAQCTINGLGERAGNAALEEVVLAASVRSDLYPFQFGIDTTKLVKTSAIVAELSGFGVAPNKAVVGGNAFAHGSGLHQDGLLKCPDTYQLYSPELIGRIGQEIVIGPHSGRRGLRFKLDALGFEFDDTELDLVLAAVKSRSEGGCKRFKDADLAAIATAVIAGRDRREDLI